MKGGDGVLRVGALGGCRGPHLAVLFLLVFFTSHTHGFDCVGQFTPRPDTSVPGGTVVFNRNVDELTEIGEPLLNLDWADGVFGDPTRDDSDQGNAFAIQYLAVAEDPAARFLNVTVFKELNGLTDFVDPGPRDSLVLEYTFPILVPDDDTTACKARMAFFLQDQNTQTPTTDAATYSTSVREDFPTQYTIPGLQALVSDLDGKAPNNVLVVTFDQDCPLTSEGSSYDASGGAEGAVTFALEEKLDYDTMGDPQVTCSVSLSDQGSEPLYTTFIITITVLPTNDETPQFQYPFYSTELMGVEAPPDPLPVEPDALLATDGDKPPQQLTYSMKILSGEEPEWEPYFSVDSASGALIQTQDIDPNLLGEDSTIHFIVTVEDDSGAKETTVLEIVLPSAPTTSTTSTTTITTIKPTTTSTTTTTETPSTTTSTTTETPSTTTSTTTEAPSTTTCTPCETTTSTVTTWTTPILSTTTTTEFETSEPTSTTTTEFITSKPPATTTETIPTTCEPVTCTCPTIESTTSTTSGGSSTSTSEITSPSLSSTDSPSQSSTTSLPSTQSSDSLGTTPTTNPSETSLQTGDPTTPQIDTSSTTDPCDLCECSTSSSTDSTTTTVDSSASSPPTTTVDSSGTPPATNAPTTAAPTSTTESPAGPTYRFEFQAYHFQPTNASTGVGQVKAVQADGKPIVGSITTYFWAPDSSPESDLFKLDPATGEITMNGATQAIYNLVAHATVDGGDLLPVDVTITVVEPVNCDNSLLVTRSVITFEAKETESEVTVGTIKTQEAADKFCITSVSPAEYAKNFNVSDQGEVKLVTAIDVDLLGRRVVVVAVRVEAQKEDDVCPKVNSGDLARNEALVLVTIVDENDQPPVLVAPSPDDNPTRVGYPTNRGLQQVVGPVITLKVADGDSVGDLGFALTGDNAGLFAVQTDAATSSGALYLLDRESCEGSCDVTVTATDGENSADAHQIEVHSLELSSIYDISLDNKSPEEMEEYIRTLSDETGLDLHLLYFSLSDPASATRGRKTPGNPATSANRGRRSLGAGMDESLVLTEKDSVEARRLANARLRGRLAQLRDVDFVDVKERDGSTEEEDEKATTWTSLVHIYGFENDGSLVSLDALNSALSGQGVQAIEFSEAATFDPTMTEEDLSGWKAAVGVLGALVGLALVVAIVGYVWYRRKQRRPPAKPSSPLAVSTIGSAYPNHGYEDTEMTRLSSSASSGDSYKNSGFKKAMGNGHLKGDSNNNNDDKTDSTPVMPSPFTSVTLTESSPTYEEPIFSLLPPTRNTVLPPPRDMMMSPPRDTSLLRSGLPSERSGPSVVVYASPEDSSSRRMYESTDSDSSQRDDALQQGGLRRITPGPLPDRGKSSPYLSKSEGDYETFRPSDTEKVASFTPYKGGEAKGGDSPTLPSSSKPASPKMSSSYKPVYKQEAAFSYLDDVPRREVRDTSDKKEKLDSPKKQTKLDTSPYAFPVRTKKEPPNLAVAAPVKPIMKSSKDSTLISTSAEVHHSADDATPSGGGFSNLKGSPPLKQKDEERERKSSLKYYTSEGETSDSELKKSVAFKVLVDEKLIKRRKDEKEREEKEKKASEKGVKKEEEEETEDL